MPIFGVRVLDDYVKAILHELGVEYQAAVKAGDVQTAKILEVMHRVILKVFS